jgi:hypothetical protein
MYQYIRVHPSSYWLIQVIESMSWFILLRRRKLPWLVCINTNQIHLGMYKDKPGTYQYIPVCTWKKQNNRYAWCSDSNQGPLA